jgi:hypothetical protein
MTWLAFSAASVAFTAFMDLAMGLTGPALGLLAHRTGLISVFLVSTLPVLGAAPVALRLRRAPSFSSPYQEQMNADAHTR